MDAGNLLASAGWLEAGQLRPGDWLRTAVGTDAVVVGLRRGVGQAAVYTLTVAHDHTFFVSQARVLVHNGLCSTVVKQLLAKAATRAPGMVVSSPRIAKGAGFILDSTYKGKKFVARVMVSGGGNTMYWRLSRLNKGAIDAVGNFTNKRSLTHVPISPNAAEEIIDAIVANVQKYP